MMRAFLLLWITTISIVLSQTIETLTPIVNTSGNAILTSSNCPSESECYKISGAYIYWDQGYVTYTLSTKGYKDLTIQYNLNVDTGSRCVLQYKSDLLSSYTVLFIYTSNTGLITHGFTSDTSDDESVSIQILNTLNDPNDNCYLDSVKFTATEISSSASSSDGSSNNRNSNFEKEKFTPFDNWAHFGILIGAVVGFGISMYPLTYPLWRMCKDCVIDHDNMKTKGIIIDKRQEVRWSGSKHQRSRKHVHFVEYKYKTGDGKMYKDSKQVYLVTSLNRQQAVDNAIGFANLQPGSKIDVVYSSCCPRLNRKDYYCIYYGYPCCSNYTAYVFLCCIMSLMFGAIIGVCGWVFTLTLTNGAEVMILCIFLSFALCGIPCCIYLVCKDTARAIDK